MKNNALLISCQKEIESALLELLERSYILSNQKSSAILSLSFVPSAKSFICNRFPEHSAIFGSIFSIASKVCFGALTPEQGLIAINHLFLTRSTLVEALQLVGAQSTFTVIDFLREAGITVNSFYDALAYRTTLKKAVDQLISDSCIDEQTIRVVTRLKYLVCTDRVECSQALDMFVFFIANRTEGETIIDREFERTMQPANNTSAESSLEESDDIDCSCPNVILLEALSAPV